VFKIRLRTIVNKSVRLIAKRINQPRAFTGNMTLITPELKTKLKDHIAELSSGSDPSKTLRPSTAVARMIGPQSSEANWENLMLKSDEPGTVGGSGSAPSPSAIFVAAIGFAENVVFARQAALQNVDFDLLETKVEANWDRKGIYGIDDADPSIVDVVIETHISTNAAPEKVAELLRLTHKRSPMTATVAKAAPIQRKLFVNGNEAPV
jgi:uncharacterized OsmC-like protein